MLCSPNTTWTATPFKGAMLLNLCSIFMRPKEAGEHRLHYSNTKTRNYDILVN